MHPRRILALPVLLSVLLSPFPASAERKPVALGLLGGISTSSFWGSDVHDFEVNVWPTTGFSLALHLPAFLGVEMDLLYASKGGFFNTVDGNRTRVNTVKAHVLEIPMLIKITAPTESEVMPIFFGGPSAAYLMSKDSYSEYIQFADGGTVIPEQTEPFIPPGDLTDWDWSLCIGGGVEWGLGTFQARVNLGQGSIDKSGKREVKTVLLAVMAGFIF